MKLKNANVMLSGQSAYFKKSGSMKNHGTVDLKNALVAYNYSEGYIGPNSILHGTDLVETTEYTQCETAMRLYLEDDWEENENERTIITNSNKIKTMLLPGETNMKNLYDSIGFTGTEIQYIQFTGTQWINTGIIPTNHKTEIKFDFCEYYNDEHLFGTDTGGGEYYHFTTFNGIYYWGGNGAEYSRGSFTSGVHTLVYNGDNHLVKLDNTQLGINNDIASPSVLLLGRRSSATNFSGTLYYVKITDKNTNTLVRDFIPVKDYNNVVCLYDKVTKKYYYNSGTGTLVAGPDVRKE